MIHRIAPCFCWRCGSRRLQQQSFSHSVLDGTVCSQFVGGAVVDGAKVLFCTGVQIFPKKTNRSRYSSRLGGSLIQRIALALSLRWDGGIFLFALESLQSAGRFVGSANRFSFLLTRRFVSVGVAHMFLFLSGAVCSRLGYSLISRIALGLRWQLGRRS